MNIPIMLEATLAQDIVLLLKKIYSFIYILVTLIGINIRGQIKDRGIELSYCCWLSPQVNKFFRTSPRKKKKKKNQNQ